MILLSNRIDLGVGQLTKIIQISAVNQNNHIHLTIHLTQKKNQVLIDSIKGLIYSILVSQMAIKL